ncbi:MAG: hypothetical protein HFE49_10225 [Clostridia bacterium]|nr:hypothetical protein [Clostridia bacterium]
MKLKRIISTIIILSFIASVFIPAHIEAADTSVYSCDFSKLVKDGQKTQYGTEQDIIQIDEYVTAHLTYDGTYVDFDGKVYIKSGTVCNRDGYYAKGSYIEFIAPSDGTINITGSDIGWFEGNTYKGYNANITADVIMGKSYYFGYRKDSTYIGTLTFTPSEKTENTPEPEQTDEPVIIDAVEYTSPSTVWNFDSAVANTGKNTPIINGNAIWENGEVKFPADNTQNGELTLNMENSIKNNVIIEFDAIDHNKALGQQYFNYSISNSEEIITEFQVHPYSDDYDGVKGLVICGETAADYKKVRAAWGSVGTHHIKTEIDYNSRKVTVSIDNNIFTGVIPEGTIADMKKLDISSTRVKTAADRYISVDNLKIEEFVSDEPQAPITVTAGYEEENISGISCRVKAENNAPAVIYLAGEQRMGADNISQLYDAKPVFDMLDGKATLIAPQANEIFTDITELVREVKTLYNASEVIVIGQSKNVPAALASGADRIITVAGSGAVKPDGRVWAFAGYKDETISDIRSMVNSFQTSGVDTRYTEYPFEGHKINTIICNENGFEEWILNNAEDNKTVDLAIFMGQSNMAGRGDYEDAIKCKSGHGFEYHSVSEPGVLTTVSEPFGKYENNDTVNDAGSNGIDRRSGDMVSAFMESYYSVSGTSIVGVQCSRGGTESSWWNSSERINEASSRYNEAKAYLESCGYTIGKKFMVWCQGEADADNNRSIDTYKSNTKNIFESLKSSTGLTDMFMIRTGHCKTSGAASIDEIKDARYKAVNLAQKDLAEEEEYITAVASFYTDEYAAQMRDQYHYYQSAYNSIGTVAGNNTAHTLYNKGEWTEYPEPAANVQATPMPVDKFEITSSETEIDVSVLENYDNMTYRVYKTDGSYETVMLNDGKFINTTGGSVTIVPEYRFEFTNQTNPAEENIKGYVKVDAGSYSAESGYGLINGIDYKINENGCRADESSPIRIKLPEGFYDVEVYRKGGVRADVYANGVQIINNTTSSGSQNRPSGSGLMIAQGMHFDEGGTDITFGNTSGANERIASIKIARVPKKYRKPVIWIAGDSESANYYPLDSDGDDLASNKIMMTGFGMQLKKVMSDKYNIANFGQPSATVKTWYNECFKSVNDLMQSGDTLIMDFGINDAISSSNKISIDEMKQYMEVMIDAAKGKNVTPIVVSPVYNGKYQHKSYFTYSTETGNNAMYAFAEECGIDCIDLNKWTQLYANKAKADTGDINWIINNYHVNDNLHLTQHSAVLAASFIAAGMSELGYETSNYSYTYKDISEVIADGNTRGEESGVSRVYSVDSAKAFMKDGTVIQPAEKLTIKYDDKTGTVTVDGGNGTVTGGTLIKAVYEGEVMKSVETQNIDFSKGAKVTPEKGMKLYLWNSLDTMTPLSDAYIYTGSGQTPAPTLSPTPTAAPDEPKEIIYSEDFEKYSVGDKAGWTSPAGTVSVKSDNTIGIGKYQTVVSGKIGTCRSGYVEFPKAISENFVFECDYKSTSDINVSDLELVENKNSIYSNHGVYSNANFAFTMARPRNSNCYVLNNKSDDSGLSVASYSDPIFKTKDITDNPWIHVKVVGDMTNQKVIVYITSLDRKEEYHHGMYDMNVGRGNKITSWKCIHLLSPTTGGDTCIDNIEIYKARKSDLAPIYHKVKMICKAYSFEQYVLDGESVINIPDISSYGQHFEGWSIGNDTTKYTSEQLKSVPITAQCEIIGHIGEGYIEALSNIEFKDFPAGNELVMGADENTFGSNLISVSITGEQGTSLVTNPDNRVTDYKVEWTFDGFRTLDGAPTGESGNKYCDSYALLETTDISHNTAVNFKLKKTSANYYGKVTATVTYNGKMLAVSKPLVLLGDKSQNSAVILPKGGYTANFNKYESSLMGYEAENNDIVTGDWSKSGSDVTYMSLQSDNSGQFLSFSRMAIGNSSFTHQETGNIEGETVFEQDIRFGMNGSIEYGADTSKGTTTAFNSTAFKLSFANSKFSFNGKEIGSGAKDTWYHIVITADPTSKLCNAKIYESDTLTAQSETVPFDSSFTEGKYLRYTLSDKTANTAIDVNNVIVRRAEIDEDTFIVTAPQTADIPESGTQTADLTVTAKTEDGTNALGKAEWIIDDEFAEGVSIASTGNQSAQLSISANASSGELPIKVTIGGWSKTVNIKLIGTKNNIAFTSAPTGVQIGTNAQYSAVLRNGQGDTITGDITYELYNAENTAKITPTGISINSSTGELTVSEDTAAQIIGIRASNGDISKFVRVNVYDLKFAFGTGSVKDGYTPVSASTTYSENRGYGIEGTATVGNGTMSNLTFKVKLEKGKVYNVKAKYNGKIVCEKINSSLTGFERLKSALETDTYDVAIFGDNIMDITVPKDSVIASVEITPVTKTNASKPDWWTIGDSTVQQNGSWGYTIAATETTDLSKYPELAEVVNGFHNSGKAGEQHRNFYSNGRLNSILTKMNIGDVVSISGMGTNDSSSTLEQFKAYDEAYMNAIIDMGGYVILGSYTPSGNYGATEGKVYDADTMTFKGMRTNAYDRAIRELYEENRDNPKLLGFIDIGKIADEKMTADVKAVYDTEISEGKNETGARTAANVKAEEMMAWWKDYNHYYTTFSNYILPDIISEAVKLIQQIQ